MVYPRDGIPSALLYGADGRAGLLYTGGKATGSILTGRSWTREGTLCAEQLLLARSYEAVASVRRLLWLDAEEFDARKEALLKNIRQFSGMRKGRFY